ncbi:energy transducer TonB [Phenylobacterium sp. LH3H17]|uniref:TonB family protein n=1 Tax=Phenylobacterium sp. LH3H17 TaxID=2903901 RepID=UPI0020CA076D|nr:TonB family protein [Phenylobacterium sp. LH3H17]UTP40197.1 energy transducer TonB [Phenylobacterium sp. LH3H17]
MLLVLAALAPASAVAEAPAADQSMAGYFVRVPTPRELASAGSRAGRGGHIAGRAVLVCLVKADGNLTECRIEDETPTGAGFGAAAMKLRSKFKLRPTTADGVSVEGGSVRIPLSFAPR